MSDFTCPGCRTPYFGNPLADTLWRCTCTPTPGRSAPAGEADDALLSGPSVAELGEAAFAVTLLVAAPVLTVGLVVWVVGRAAGVW